MAIYRFACAAFLLTLTLASCGTKPDGTPYGVDPAKLPEGRRKAAAAAAAAGYGPGTGMPKGAEMNAVTSGARAGQPLQTTAPDAPAR